MHKCTSRRQVKLSLNEGQSAPSWVQELLDSGYLTEARGRGGAGGME